MSSVFDRFRMDGKNAVITGGSRGIGRAVALALAEAGANVVVASRDGDRCVEVAGEVAHHGVRGLGCRCDVTDEEQVTALFNRVATELGGCDVFVHSAGVADGILANDVTRQDIQRMLDIHLLGGVTAAQSAAIQMRARGGGAILLITSVWGLGGAVRTLGYGAAKAALAHTVKVLALEWAGDSIRVNGLAPGLVETDMTRALEPKAREGLIRRIPMRRPAEPDEMASAALFLCSPAASYVHGHILVADGGERAR